MLFTAAAGAGAGAVSAAAAAAAATATVVAAVTAVTTAVAVATAAAAQGTTRRARSHREQHTEYRALGGAGTDCRAQDTGHRALALDAGRRLRHRGADT